MEDNKIVDLYWERSEAAVLETQKKYGRYCHYIAYHILYSDEDAEECVNDTYIKAWNAMPPHRPERLSSFLGKITRNTALDYYSYLNAGKRSGNTTLVLDEMAECIPDPRSEAPLSDEIALKNAINGFLASLPKQTRIIFMRRYWYLSSIKEIANDYRLSESNVKVTLHRTRNKFKEYLEKEGIIL